MEATCPICNSEKVFAQLGCHTWERDGIWMSCTGCDSAVEYVCDECSWMYVHGLNKRNPIFEKHQEQKPKWLKNELEYDKLIKIPVKHKDIKWYWEDEDEDEE